MKCDDIHCWKLLLDLEGTQHNTVSYFTKIIFLLLHWMSYMLYTSPGEVRVKLRELKIFKERGGNWTRSSHTIISISALNMYNNANFGFSLVASGLFSTAWSRQMSTVKKTGQGRTSTWHWTQITVFQGIGLWIRQLGVLDSSEGVKGRGKCRRDQIVLNCIKVVRW